MANVYQWTEDEDEVALDAVTVGIRSDTRILTVAGLAFGQREAVIYWPDWTGNQQSIPASVEGPLPVVAALKRAEDLRAQYGFKRIVIWVQHRELWDERWGKLAASVGL